MVAEEEEQELVVDILLRANFEGNKSAALKMEIIEVFVCICRCGVAPCSSETRTDCFFDKGGLPHCKVWHRRTVRCQSLKTRIAILVPCRFHRST